MSECVVNMEKPENCGACPCLDDYGDYPRCRISGEQRGYDFPIHEKRMPNCPIICQLPEGHGRLVDEKEVKDWVENWLCVNKYYHPYSSSKSIPVSELYDVLQRMDAAVQAERSET